MARGNDKKRSKKKPIPLVDLDDDEEMTFPMEEEEPVYEVERVVDRRVDQLSGMTQFLLKWKGYPDDQNTWEYEHSLQCPNLVQDFLKRQKQEELGFKTPPQTESKPVLNRNQKENQTKSIVETKKTKLTNKPAVQGEQVVKPRMIDAALRIRQEIDQRSKQQEATKSIQNLEERGRESVKIKKQETEKARSITKQERDEQPMLEDDDSVIHEFIPKSIGKVEERPKLETNSAVKSKKSSPQERRVVPYKVPVSAEKKNKEKAQEVPIKKSKVPEIKDCKVSFDVRGFSRGLEPEEIVAITELPNCKSRFFLMRWKGDRTLDLILDAEANRVCPQLVIAFYQARLRFKNGAADLTF